MPSQDVLDLLKKNHGIELKSASSTLEEIVARQFVERHAKQRNIELPKGDIFSETAAKAVKGKAGAARKAGAAPEPPKPVVPTLGPPRLVKKPTLVKPAHEAHPEGEARHSPRAEVHEPEHHEAHEPAAVETRRLRRKCTRKCTTSLRRSRWRRNRRLPRRCPFRLRWSRSSPRRWLRRPKPCAATARSARRAGRRRANTAPPPRRRDQPAVSCRRAFACAWKNLARRLRPRRHSCLAAPSCRCSRRARPAPPRPVTPAPAGTRPGGVGNRPYPQAAPRAA